ALPEPAAVHRVLSHRPAHRPGVSAGCARHRGFGARRLNGTCAELPAALPRPGAGTGQGGDGLEGASNEGENPEVRVSEPPTARACSVCHHATHRNDAHRLKPTRRLALWQWIRHDTAFGEQVS